MKRSILFVLFLGFAAATTVTAQPDANAIVQEILRRGKLVNSFEADVTIDVDVDFIKIPVKQGKVFYKAPDKFRFRAPGFALIPKRGLNFSVMEMLSGSTTAIYAGDDAQNHILKIVPLDDKADFVLSTFWVDKKNTRISRMEVNTKGKGNFLVEFTYGRLSYDLPETSTVSFDLQPVDIPMNFAGNFKIDQSKAKDRSQGRVVIRYSNYRVNGSIPETVFLED
ncbi:MAG: hypothetical protein IPM52_12945 [Bacteroidetes bacterium]|nr:hypothetical protein [Bacteroidota bacterium]